MHSANSIVAGSELRAPLLEVDHVSVRYRAPGGRRRSSKGWIQAVREVSFTLEHGETLGLVGESGCGKSTTARAIAMLTPTTEGRVRLDGTDLATLSRRNLRQMRRKMQVVFQDPHASLDPRMRVGAALRESLAIHGIARGNEARKHVAATLEAVGLPDETANRFPHEFSGGQRQRIAIARALVVSPELLICDEPVSALDVSVRAQIVNLLTDLQERLSLAVLFIAHDLAIVRQMANRIAVMYLGEIVELGPAHDLCASPLHPYTQSLISAVPTADPLYERRRERIVLKGDLPSPLDPPTGCRFHTRCPHARDICAVTPPKLEHATPDRTVACHFWRELSTDTSSRSKSIA